MKLASGRVAEHKSNRQLPETTWLKWKAASRAHWGVAQGSAAIKFDPCEARANQTANSMRVRLVP